MRLLVAALATWISTAQADNLNQLDELMNWAETYYGYGKVVDENPPDKISSRPTRLIEGEDARTVCTYKLKRMIAKKVAEQLINFNPSDDPKELYAKGLFKIESENEIDKAEIKITKHGYSNNGGIYYFNQSPDDNKLDFSAHIYGVPVRGKVCYVHTRMTIPLETALANFPKDGVPFYKPLVTMPIFELKNSNMFLPLCPDTVKLEVERVSGCK